MDKGKGKTIDYLFEDPIIPSQRFALVSVVGPNSNQKCDVWGLKVRGVAETESEIKSLAQRLMKVDDTYDIYTVDVGKFFPLVVDPTAITNVEYQDKQLNELVKNYIQNKELANQHWTKRKNDMIKEAINEGKSQDFANKPEHPVAVLHRINTYKETLEKLQQELDSTNAELSAAKSKFLDYSQEERDLAEKEVKSVVNNNPDANFDNDFKNLDLNAIRQQLLDESTS